MTKCCVGLTTSLLFLSMDMEGCFRGASAKLLGKSDGWIESCGQVVLGECYVRCDKVRLSISIIRGLDSGLLMAAAPTADEKRRQENGGSTCTTMDARTGCAIVQRIIVNHLRGCFFSVLVLAR